MGGAALIEARSIRHDTEGTSIGDVRCGTRQDPENPRLPLIFSSPLSKQDPRRRDDRLPTPPWTPPVAAAALVAVFFFCRAAPSSLLPLPPGAAFMFRSAHTVDPGDAGAVERLLSSVYGHAGWRAPEFLAGYLGATTPTSTGSAESGCPPGRPGSSPCSVTPHPASRCSVKAPAQPSTAQQPSPRPSTPRHGPCPPP
jgi:hypothetical protein